MEEGSDESPLDLMPVLGVLESDTSSDEQLVDAYTRLSHHINKELSLFERDFVEHGRRLVAVTKKHMTSDGELKHSVTPKALSVMSYCVNTSDIVNQLSAAEMGDLLQLWSKIITQTKETFTCANAFSCVNSQRFPAGVVSPELPTLMTAFCRTAVSWWGVAPKVEHMAMLSIQRLGEQCPKEITSLCGKWGPPYLRLLASNSPHIRDHVYGKLLKWVVFLACSEEFVSAGISIVTKQIVPVLNEMFSNSCEAFALKTCTLLMRLFKQELQNITLINSLLTIQEQAFRCSSTEIRFCAFSSWGVLIDILSEKGIHRKQKFVELIMRVFKNRNAKTERVALAKLHSWWHYVLLMGTAVWAQFDQILKPLLQFCLGNARLGTDSGSYLNRAIPDPYGDAVAGSSIVPGSPVSLPAFPQVQQGTLVILTYLFQYADHPATSAQDLKPLECENVMPLSVFIKNAHLLISAMVEVSKLFATTHESQLMYVWARINSYLQLGVERDRDDSNAAVSSFLSQFQTLASTNVLNSKMEMQLFKLVCTLPEDVLSSPSLVDGSLFKCRSHSLCELLLSSSVLTDYGEQESYVTLFMKLIKSGTKQPGTTLPFLETVGKLLDSRAPAMLSAHVLWRMWSYVAHVLQEYISATNQVDQDDGLWPNFGCLYTVLLLPVSYLLGPRVPQTVHKTAARTMTDLYLTFARLAAMVTTAEDNMVIEEFSHKILSKVSVDSYEKDLQTLDHLLELCQTIVGTIDFSSLTSANPFMKGIRTTPSSKQRSSLKPLGNLHSFVSLLSRLVTWVMARVQQEGDKSSDDKQKSSEISAQLGSCCSRLMEIVTQLVTSVAVSSLVPHLLETMASPVGSFIAAVPKKLPAKITTASFMQKLGRLWQEWCSMVRNRYKGPLDSDLLQQMSPLLVATFRHSRSSVKNQTVQLWNATFGASSAPLTYPADLQGVLAKMPKISQLTLPGWTAVDVAVIDETPVSQMSQMDSEAPEPLLPGMPSPVRMRGSFLHKDVSPKTTPKSASPKRILPESENKKSASSSRKRLPLECFSEKDFVVITPTTTKKRRVLTEHQKEVLREKRALPAMYNNLDASLDVSLMAHFSSDNTQQDSILEKPTFDDVIVVNSSQSQDLDPKPASTDPPSQEKAEDHLPRRSSRRSSVRFLETKDRQSSDPPVKKISEEKIETVSTSEKSQQQTKEKQRDSELAFRMTSEEKSEVISIENSSQDTDQNSEPQEKSVILPTPQPNVMASTAEKWIDSSSSKDTSQLEISKSSDDKRETRSTVRRSACGRRSFSASLDPTLGRQSSSRTKGSLKPRTLSQEIKSSREVPDAKQQKPKDTYDIFKNWLNRSSSEEQTRKNQSSVSEKRTGKGDNASSTSSEVEKQSKAVIILAEETKLSPESVTETTAFAAISVKETPTKISSSKVISDTGMKRRSTRRNSMIVEHPGASLSKSPVDSEQSVSFASLQDAEDTPAQHTRFKLPPPMVCDEVASQGFPGDSDSAQSSIVEPQGQKRPKRKRSLSVDDSTDQSRPKGGSLLDKHSEIGFSGFLKQSLDQGSESSLKTGPGEESEKSTPVQVESPVRETYNPLLEATLRLTPPTRRSSRCQTSDTPEDATDSQKLSTGADDSGNMSPVSQNDMTDSPSTFDPTKNSTLIEQTERSRKRKQQTPKKIADPSLLRRTPRTSRHKPGCSCCKTQSGKKRHSSGQAEKGNKKQSQGEVQSPLCGRSKQENGSQSSQRCGDSTNSKNSVRKEDAASDSDKNKISLSPQDFGEVTPKSVSKTSSTPLRQSTTEKRKKVAKQMSASKSVAPSVVLSELDSEGSRSHSQSATTSKRWKKDVFDSKKDPKKDEDMDVLVCSERTEISPTALAMNKSPVKTLSRLKSRKTGLKFETGIRSPPRLRLRQKKTASSGEAQSDSKIVDTEATEKMDESKPFEGLVQSEPVEELDLGSKTELKLNKDDGRKLSLQRKKRPMSAQSAFTSSPLAGKSLKKQRRESVSRCLRRSMRKQSAGKETELQDMSMETESEAASEEALIERYESDPSSNVDTSLTMPQGSQALESKKGSKPQNQSPEGNSDMVQESWVSDVEVDSQPQESHLPHHTSEGKTPENTQDSQSEKQREESQSQEDKGKNKTSENCSQDGEKESGKDEGESRPEEMESTEEKSRTEKGMLGDRARSEGFETTVTERTALTNKRTEAVMADVQEKKSDVQEEKSSDDQEEKSSDVQEEKSSDVQEEKSSVVQEEKSSDVQEKKSSDVQEEKSSDVQEEKSSDVQEEKSSYVQEEKSSDVQEDKSSDVQEEKSSDVQEKKSSDVQEKKSSDVQEKKSSDVQEKKSVTCQGSLSTREHDEADMNMDQSEDIFGDTPAETVPKPSTSVMHIAHCGGTGYTQGEGSIDMFGEDGPGSSQPSPPLAQRCHTDGKESLGEDSDSELVSMFSEEVLEADFPDNQRGLEMEQDSVSPVGESGSSIEMTGQQDGLDSSQGIEQNRPTPSAHMASNNHEESSRPTTTDQVQKTSSEETIPELPRPKLSKTELFMLIDESEASTQEIIDYLQSRQRNKRSSHSAAGPSEAQGDSGSSEGHSQDKTVLESESPNHGDSHNNSGNTGASLFGESCDEVDCPISLADCPTKMDSSHSSNQTSFSPADDTSSCVASKTVSASSDSPATPSELASAVSVLGTPGASIPQASEDSHTEEEHQLDDGLSSSTASLTLGGNSLESTQNESQSGVPESGSLIKLTSSAGLSESSASSANVSAEPCSSADASSRKTESSTLSETSEKQTGAEGTVSKALFPDTTSSPYSSRDLAWRREMEQDSAEAGTSSSISQLSSLAAVASGIPQASTSAVSGSSTLPSQSPSPGILKRRFHNSPLTSSGKPSVKKAKRLRVSFTSPVEEEGAWACTECGGFPSCEPCDQCLKPGSEERRSAFRETVDRIRSKKKKRTRSRRRIRLGDPVLQTASPVVSRPGISTSRLFHSPSVSTNAQSAGTPRGTQSQQNSETASNNSYHSTQESQLDSVNPVFSDLAECGDPFDGILPSLTTTMFGRGLQSMLMGRGIKTVGHLASLTEFEVEKLPFSAPKAKTLRNALRIYQEKHRPAKAAEESAQSEVQW
ncbi:hypothetical protein ACOMHN_005992 [Nucella lapillus]